MKFPFFKSFLLAGALLLAWNCSDDTIVLPASAVSMYEDARMFSSDDGVLFILSDGTVIDGSGQTVGHLEGNVIIGLDEQPYIEVPPEEELDSVRIAKNREGVPLIVTNDGDVLDANGNKIGAVNDDGDIVNDEGEVILEHLDPQNTDPDSGNGENQQQNGKPASSTSNGNNNSNQTGNSSASNGNQTGTSSASNGNNNTPTSVSSVTEGNITYTDNLTQSVAKGSAITPIVISGMQAEPSRQSWNAWFLNNGSSGYENGKLTISGDVPEYPCGGSSTCELEETWIIDGKAFTIKINITEGSGNNNNNNQNQNPKPNPGTSSSSKQQQTPSSSSKQQQTPSSASQQTTGCPTITYVNGGQSGNGFASRYWDGCKPSCSWTGNTNKLAKQCSANGKTQLTDYSARSVCDGGPAATCTSHIPFTKDGCTNIGFAFAAVPSNSPACGRCFELTFTGEGKYESKKNHRNLKGKKLIVMASNIGGDVSGGQFDILIPGGGWGIFNGLSGYGWGSQGKQYGGLLSECEESAGYNGSDDEIYTKRKECLINKCNSVFSSDSEAKSGCLFLANFMEAAGNPLHTYKEVNCPAELSSRYNN